MTSIRVRYVPPGSDDPVAGWIRFVPRSFDPNSPIADGPDVLIGDTGQIEIEPGMNTIEVRPTSSGWFYTVQGRAGRHTFTTNVLVPPSGEHDFESLVRVDPKAGGLEYEPDPEWRADLDSIRHMGGIPGPDGADAYQVAVREGFEGTEEEWLDSLVGPQGDKGDKGDAGEGIGDTLSSDQYVSGDWTFSRGHTTNNDRSRVSVEREYSQELGDLFDSTARIELSMRNQQGTSQNPPGYSMGTISLYEDGENGEQYQGESARMALISNRILFNRRLEVDMGGDGRATVRSGRYPGEQFARLSLHNSSYPRLTVYGPNNEAGGYANDVVVERATLRIVDGGPNAFRTDSRDSQDRLQRIDFAQFGAGHQAIRGHHDGVTVGQVRFEHSDMSLRLLSGEGGIRLENRTLANDDIELAAGKNVIVRSPSGTRWRIKVDDDGSLSTEAA